MASVDQPRKKSPRAPSIALDDALERVLKIYEKERLHAVPADVVAQHIGYKNASSGVALSALASLRYYGLVDRPSDGQFCVNKQVEAYKFAPSEELKQSFLLRFLTTPPLFAELVDRYQSGLPSDGNLKYELIQRGFLPATAESVVNVFKKSVSFVGVFDENKAPGPVSPSEEDLDDSSQASPIPAPVVRPAPASVYPADQAAVPAAEEVAHDRIPVRLSGGRRAWLVIPAVFYEADKQRLKAQIDLLLTQEDDQLL